MHTPSHSGAVIVWAELPWQRELLRVVPVVVQCPNTIAKAVCEVNRWWKIEIVWHGNLRYSDAPWEVEARLQRIVAISITNAASCNGAHCPIFVNLPNALIRA